MGFLEKGKPAARPGRKAMGLTEIARLPKDNVSGSICGNGSKDAIEEVGSGTTTGQI